jgi:hypothetical protein
MHTGSADEVRQLHSDNTLLSYEFKLVGLGTSVTMPNGFAPDALRRMLHVELKPADDHPDTGNLWQDYDKIKPQVLGALYTLVAKILERLDEAMAEPLPGCPEMAGYARRLYAADLTYPDLGLYKAYASHTGDIMAEKGMNDPLVQVLSEALDKLPGKKFDDTPARLHGHLSAVAGIRASARTWPPDATRMGKKLTELDAPLRNLGVVVERGPRTRDSQNYVITKSEPDTTGGAG